MTGQSVGGAVATRPLPRWPATAALAGATAVWGSTFLVTKNAVADMPPAAFLAWRFGIAAAVMAAVGAQRVRRLDRPDRARALALGGALAAGFLLQTAGLRDTPAAVSGFLTGTMVVLTPVVAATAFGERVGRAGWLAVVVATAGLALLTLRGGSLADWSASRGELLTLAGAGCFAVHIASLSRWASRRNAYGLTVVSVATAAALCAVAAQLSGGLAAPPSSSAWWSVLYLALAATALGFAVQAWAQAALAATTAAVVMTLEPLAAGVIAVVVGGEVLGAPAWAGGVLVVAGMLVAELGPRDCCDATSPRVECC